MCGKVDDGMQNLFQLTMLIQWNQLYTYKKIWDREKNYFQC